MAVPQTTVMPSPHFISPPGQSAKVQLVSRLFAQAMVQPAPWAQSTTLQLVDVVQS
jgi:hypothetical protein